MSLSTDLVSQFVKATTNAADSSKETIVYGTYKGNNQVLLDGSDNQLTPVTTTADAKVGERVSVLLKNHTAMITGNVSDPSAGLAQVNQIDANVTQIDSLFVCDLTADQLTAIDAYINDLKAVYGEFNYLEAVEADIDNLYAKIVEANSISASDIEALNADIETLRARTGTFDDLTTDDLESINAYIDNLEGYVATFHRVTTDELIAANAQIDILNSEKLSADEAKMKYAYIDFTNIGEAAMNNFYASSGLIKDVVVENGTITGEIVGVTIKGDLIEGGTVVADKLILKGLDGLYYKINNDIGALSAAMRTNYYKVELSTVNFPVEQENTYYKIDYSDGEYILTSEVIDITGTTPLGEILDTSDTVIGYKAKALTGETIYYYAQDESVVTHTEELYLVTDTILDDVGDGTIVEDLFTYPTNEQIYSKTIDDANIYYCIREEADVWTKESIHGSAIAAKSITADQISVSDLVAFGATIGGFIIDDNIIRSTGKSTVASVGRGIYMDTDGQFSIGNVDNYLRFFKDTDGTYKLQIAAESVTFKNSSDDVIKDLTDRVEIGTTDSEPSITLYETSSKAKQILTNSKTTYVDDNGETGTVIDANSIKVDGIKQGGWAWFVHNGNLGLAWEGDD